ncbi:MAG: hypothetical protein C5B52_03170 [Bacteroidetes bacterium]|nr:MAG: hypothetical protein C5B52_03170 [Bacteroidota bacterium]
MFNEFIENKKLGGVNTLIWKEGQVIYQESEGYKNLESFELMTRDTIFRIASMTKPVTSVLTMILYEEGKLDLSDPITKWFPQFENMKVLNRQTGEFENANRLITILDLLTHRSGFTYSDFLKGKLKEDYIDALGPDIDTEIKNKQWVNGLAKLPLISQPGELFYYSRSTDFLGILISSIEGKSLGEVMQEKLFGPLTMKDTFFYVPDEKKSRCASNMGYDESANLTNLETVPARMALKDRPRDMEFESGGQGLWSTIGDYLQFAKLFVEKGCPDGVRILEEETIQLICTNQLTSPQREQGKLMGSSIFKEYYGFGLGVAVATKENKYGSIPCIASLGSVGWPGAYGCWWSADPTKKAISLFLTHCMTEAKQFTQGIGFELYEAIDIFARYSRENT